MEACPKCGHNRHAQQRGACLAVSGLRRLRIVSTKPTSQAVGKGWRRVRRRTKVCRQRARDASVWSLVLVNGIALLVALAGGWSLIDLMAVYWVQSVIIGISYFFRMLNLKQFSTENFRINDRSVDPTPETKRQTAFFFLFHFGFFHVGYLVFIFAPRIPGGSPLGLGLLICTVVPLPINHYFSYRYHRAGGRERHAEHRHADVHPVPAGRAHAPHHRVRRSCPR